MQVSPPAVSPSTALPVDAIPEETSSDVPITETSASGWTSGAPEITGTVEPSEKPSGFGEFPSGVPEISGLPSGESGLPSGDISGLSSGIIEVSTLPSGEEELSGISSGTQEQIPGPHEGKRVPEFSGLPSGFSGDHSGPDLSGSPSGEYDYSGLTSGFPTVSLVNATLTEVVTTATEREMEGKGTIGVSGDGDVSGFPSADWDVSGTTSGLPSGVDVYGTSDISGFSSGIDSSGELSSTPDISELPSGLDVSGQSSGLLDISGLSSGIDISGTSVGPSDLSGYVDLSGQPSGTDGSGEPSGVTFVDVKLFEVTTPSSKEEEGKGFVEISGLPSGDEDLSGTTPGILDVSGQPSSGQVDFSGWASGVTEVSGLPSGQTDISGGSSGVDLVSGTSSGTYDYSGLTSGFPTVSLVDTTLVEVVTQPSVPQELGEGTSGILEISGLPSGQEQTSGALYDVTTSSGVSSEKVDFSGTSSGIPYFGRETDDVSGASSTTASASGDVSGISEIVLVTDSIETVTRPTVLQQLIGGTEVTHFHFPESSGEGPTSDAEISMYPESTIASPEYPEISSKASTFYETSVGTPFINETSDETSVSTKSHLETSTHYEPGGETSSSSESYSETSGVPFITGFPSGTFDERSQVNGDSSGPAPRTVSDTPEKVFLPGVLLSTSSPDVELTEHSRHLTETQPETEASAYPTPELETGDAAAPGIPRPSPTATDLLPSEMTDGIQLITQGKFRNTCMQWNFQ